MFIMGLVAYVTTSICLEPFGLGAFIIIVDTLLVYVVLNENDE
jgi:hypothetical protein